MLRRYSKSQAEVATWQAMDKATYQVLEKIGGNDLEYWHAGPNEAGCWKKEQPPTSQTHVPILVHESSTMPLGNIADGGPAVVDPEDYQLKGTKNVHITGGALWPRGGSWNPTLTMVALAADPQSSLSSRLTPSSRQWHERRVLLKAPQPAVPPCTMVATVCDHGV